MKQRRRGGGEGAERLARRRRARERNVLLGAVGLQLGFATAAALRLLGRAEVELWQLGLLALGADAWFFALWLTPRLGWDRWLTWDPKFLYLPPLSAVVILDLLTVLVPETRSLLFAGFFLILLFGVGIASFREVLAFSSILALGYVVTLRWLAAASRVEVDWIAVTGHAIFLLGAGTYAALVLDRARRGREETQELRRRLARLALVDPLTELPNRRRFEEVAGAEATGVAQGFGVCSFALLDLDRFKEFNDRWGHFAGDEALQALGALLRSQLRASDMVARIGGEEFAAICTGADRQAAVAVVERLRSAVAAHPFPGPHGPLHLTISGGVATMPDDGADYRQAMENADRALYEAKRRGRNRVVAYAPLLDRRQA